MFHKNALHLTCSIKCFSISTCKVLNLLRLRLIQNWRPCFCKKQHWTEMLGSYWSISFNIFHFFTLSSKKFIFKKPLSLDETMQGRRELIDRNVLFSEMLHEIRTCTMTFNFRLFKSRTQLEISNQVRINVSFFFRIWQFFLVFKYDRLW